MCNSKLLNQCNKIKNFFSEISNIGYEKGYTKRVSKLDPLTLIKTMIMTQYHNKQISLNAYRMNYGLLTGKEISRQAIDQRINTSSVEIEKEILTGLLKIYSECSISIKPKLLKPFGNLHVIDSTVIDLPPQLKDDFKGFGGSGNKEKTKSAMKLHVVYDPLSKEYKYVGITDAVSTDKVHITDENYLNNLNNNDMVIFDLSYFCIDVLKKVEEKSSYYVCRMKFNTKVYKKATRGRKKWIQMDIYKLLRRAKQKYIYDLPVYITEKKISCRLIIFPVKKDVAKERLRRKKKDYRRKGFMVSKRHKASLSYCLMITNAPTDVLKTRDVYDFYRVRWSIELLFKFWKSKLCMSDLQGFRKERILFELYGKLICTVLLFIFSSTSQLDISPPGAFLELSFDKCYEYFTIVLYSIISNILVPSVLLCYWSSYCDTIRCICLKRSYRKRPTTLSNLEKHNKGGYMIKHKLQ